MVEYSARFLGACYMRRDLDTPLSLGVYRDGVAVAPVSGTITIYDANNAVVVAAAAITVAGNVATYTVPTATVGSLTLGPGWRVSWSLLMPDGYTHVYEQQAALVRVLLASPITDEDLYLRHPELRSFIQGGTYQNYIDAAHREIGARLEAGGKRPWLVMTPESFFTPELLLTLALVCRAFAGTGEADNKWAVLAESYEVRFERAWSALNFVYDESGNASGDATSTRRKAARPQLWLTSRGPASDRDRWGMQ